MNKIITEESPLIIAVYNAIAIYIIGDVLYRRFEKIERPIAVKNGFVGTLYLQVFGGAAY